MAVLVVENLSKRFGGLLALTGVSFAVEPGEIFSIIGPNGAGKSTLLKLIAGFERPTGGRVRLADQDLAGLPPHRIAAAGIVRTFQENTIFSDMTPRAALQMAQHRSSRTTLAGLLLGTPRARAEEHRFAATAEALLAKLALADVADVPCVELSHGHLRRLGIAVALAVEPKVLLLDEPFAGLNHTETSAGMELVCRLRSEGLTIVLVEHDMRAVMSVSDRVLVLNFGTPVALGPPASIQSDPAVIEAYLGSPDLELGL